MHLLEEKGEREQIKGKISSYSSCYSLSPGDSVTLIRLKSAGPDVTCVAHCTSANFASA